MTYTYSKHYLYRLGTLLMELVWNSILQSCSTSRANAWRHWTVSNKITQHCHRLFPWAKKPVQLRGNQAVRLSKAQPGTRAHSIAAELSVVHNAMRRQRYNRPLRVLGIRRQYTISVMKIIVILHPSPFIKKQLCFDKLKWYWIWVSTNRH